MRRHRSARPVATEGQVFEMNLYLPLEADQEVSMSYSRWVAGFPFLLYISNGICIGPVVLDHHGCIQAKAGACRSRGVFISFHIFPIPPSACPRSSCSLSIFSPQVKFLKLCSSISASLNRQLYPQRLALNFVNDHDKDTSGQLKTPALLITPSKSCKPTPLLAPEPPFASNIISLST